MPAGIEGEAEQVDGVQVGEPAFAEGEARDEDVAIGGNRAQRLYGCVGLHRIGRMEDEARWISHVRDARCVGDGSGRDALLRQNLCRPCCQLRLRHSPIPERSIA